MAIITVLGAGMMGSAWCVPLVDAGHEVRLVGTHLDDALIDGLKRDGVHPKLNFHLPEAIQPFYVGELARALEDAEVIGLGVSSLGIRWAAETLAPYLGTRPVMAISKGLEWNGQELVILPDVFAEALKQAAPAATQAALSNLSPVAVAGPCIAGELARRVETCVVMSGRDPAVTRQLAELVRTPYYHAFPSDDVMGVEACAALKNAYAMGIAFAAGIHEAKGGEAGSVAMHNHESAVFAQAVLEMQTLVELLGGEARTAAGLAGVGDLDVTCNGGRTGRFGRLLGSGLSKSQAVERMQGATLECLEILRVMREAVVAFESAGRLPRGSLPLLMHMADVVQRDEAVNVPFPRFFGGLS
ncbi:MAG: 2-dehydropantoate 2-reductase N-terminal domain-containing protein [Polyangiaceae bacterium]